MTICTICRWPHIYAALLHVVPGEAAAGVGKGRGPDLTTRGYAGCWMQTSENTYSTTLVNKDKKKERALGNRPPSLSSQLQSASGLALGVKIPARVVQVAMVIVVPLCAVVAVVVVGLAPHDLVAVTGVQVAPGPVLVVGVLVGAAVGGNRRSHHR